MNKVAVRAGKNGSELARECLENLELDPSFFRGKTVLVKPNAGRMAGPGQGINTHPDVVAGVLDFLKDKAAESVSCGESPILGVKALESLEISGIAGIARERGIPLLDLDAEKPVELGIPEGTVIDKLRVCRKAAEADLIISVPVAKTHMHTQVSLGLKNMKGCLYEREKVKLHQLPPSDRIPEPAKPLDMAIADMARILMPSLTVIDGTWGQEGLGPSAGTPVRSGFVIASRNCLAADRIACLLMGRMPDSVQHHRLAVRALESIAADGSDIRVNPPDFLKWKKEFAPPPEKISLEYMNVKVDDRDSCSACQSTLLMFLKRFYNEFADYFTPDNPLHIAMGKGIGPQRPGTLLLGNCTIHRKDGNVFIKGCPPVASDVKKEVDRLIDKIKKNR